MPKYCKRDNREEIQTVSTELRTSQLPNPTTFQIFDPHDLTRPNLVQQNEYDIIRLVSFGDTEKQN